MDSPPEGAAPPVELSVVLPCYKEAENLKVLAPAIGAVCRELGVPHEIVAVDTMAPMDDSRAICESAGVRYVNRTGGNDYGDAVRSGIASARGRFVVFMDADHSHDPAFIRDLFARRNDADVVVASRYVPGGDTENPWALIFMSRALNVIYSLVLGIKCRDVSNSFRLYNGGMLRSLSLRCTNFDIVEEILYKLSRRPGTLRIVEIPYTFRKRMFGRTKRNLVAFMFTFLVTLVRLKAGAIRDVRSGER